jgi:hypothetical protein
MAETVLGETWSALAIGDLGLWITGGESINDALPVGERAEFSVVTLGLGHLVRCRIVLWEHREDLGWHRRKRKGTLSLFRLHFWARQRIFSKWLSQSDVESSRGRCDLTRHWEGRFLYWGKRHLIWDPVQDGFKNLADRKIRERRRDERRLAEQQTTKHQLEARKSCVADARSYRVARQVPVPPATQFERKTLIPVERFTKIGSACLKKFGNHQFKRWLQRQIGRQSDLFRLLRRLTR